MVEDYFKREQDLFISLTRKLNLMEKIRLDDSVVPINHGNDKINVYFSKNNPLWLIRLEVQNEVYYYFGLKKSGNINIGEDIFARLLFKVNFNYPESIIKFYKNGRIGINLRIKDDDEEIYQFLNDKFIITNYKKDDKKYLLYLIYKNKNELIQNIEKLVTYFEFDLSPDKEYIVINNILKSNEYDGIKINKEIITPKINKKRVIISKTPKIKEKTIFKSPTIEQVKEIPTEPPKGKIDLDIIKKYFPYRTAKIYQLEIISEIVEAIDWGYKYIILEAGPGKSAIARTLAGLYETSFIFASNEKLQNKYNKDFKLRKISRIHLSNYDDIFNEFEQSKRKLLIMDDAHWIDEKIAKEFSYTVDLSRHADQLNNFKFKVKDLPNKEYGEWFEFIDYLSLDDEKINIIKKYIEQNPDNWKCSYEKTRHYDKLTFYPLNVGNLAKRYLFDKGEVCIFMSSTILSIDKFSEELGLDCSKIRYIHEDLPFNSSINRIYARNSMDISDDTLHLSFPVIEEILNKHINEKGVIHTNKNEYSLRISRNINNKRLLTHKGYDYYKKIESFKKSHDGVIVSDSMTEGIAFPHDDCRFQIILKKHARSWNSRAKYKENESNWYSYKTAISIVQTLLRSTRSNQDWCTNYILDENIFKNIIKDATGDKFIPQPILDSIVDMDMEDCGLVSDNIKKQFGVYYLFDYVPPKKEDDCLDSNSIKLSREVLFYKDYNFKKPKIYLNEFNFFTKKFMEAISEFSNQIIDENITKLALVCVPSSTTERDQFATVRQSINCIMDWYESGLAKSKFGCKKEIVDCRNVLTRISNVETSHLSDKRPSYSQHINSIKCGESDILKRNDVAFIILDDISTRGTIMNACEDLLVKNGVNRKNIYKFALFKTLW